MQSVCVTYICNGTAPCKSSIWSRVDEYLEYSYYSRTKLLLGYSLGMAYCKKWLTNHQAVPVSLKISNSTLNDTSASKLY